MASHVRQPRLVVVVANDIRGDSRVQKTAIAAARDGWDVTMVGRTDGTEIEHTTMGSLKVVRVPVVAARQQSRLGRTADRLARSGSGAENRSRARGVARVGELGMHFARRVVGKVRHEVRQIRAKRTAQAAPTGDWRRDWPMLVQLDRSFVPVIVDLAPDVIHANDIGTIVVAAHAADQLRAAGHNCSWLYDAHEYVRGVQWPNRMQASGCISAEREFIHQADAVVTVSTQLSDMLRSDHDLSVAPIVVGNSPVREIIKPTARLSVRTLCNLSEDTPLMVYAGWMGKERGLDIVIAGMAKLPGYHLALVVGRSNPLLAQLLQQAEEVGVRERVHLLPYVPQHEVAAYLNSADLGLIPFRRVPNTEISLPTKISEYLHARLPLVTSDVKVVRAFVEDNGIGEVFPAEDADAFAEAAEKAYAQRAALRARITEPILDELSWEYQSRALLRLYRDLSAQSPSETFDLPWDSQEEDEETLAEQYLTGDWREIGDTRVRLGLGPANYAGQGAAFAKAICRERPDVSAEVVMVRQAASFGFPANVYLDVKRLSDFNVQSQQIHRIIGRYTHVLADAFMPVFGHLNGTTIEGDLPMLARAGVKVAILAHGSEIRDPRRHLKNHEFSLFRDAPDGIAAALTKKTRRNQKIADSCGLPLFVTTPDLLDDLPTATWAPLVIDIELWANDRPVMERKRPIVMHAPSQRWTKGTDRILPALTRLHKQEVIDLRLAEGLPWAQMKELVQESDIVLDQFTTGAYGTLGCEAMAAGKPVVAYISERVSQAVGPDLPIVRATPNNLVSVLESMLGDRAGTARIGSASAAFAREFHDGRRTAAALATFLG
ncbi:hypothetical protein Cme02nite_68950 [Catellatospora methionotrophica]|uniref:Channel forming colicins domain-containing protein n=1 Tax=Catellatospora methionotrophica TaxID=121620 RepID=A0A8J3LCU3_9ACTN|nr:glycosyltransferase [Catellatospora methionotrophica]GIG18563.1 hypothetical protein Cme02nite_68950 [Catellatospora methionotrophica]